HFKLFVFSTKFQTFENNFAILVPCKYINPPNNCKGYKIRLFRICFSFFRHYTTKGSKNITHSAQPSEWRGRRKYIFSTAFLFFKYSPLKIFNFYFKQFKYFFIVVSKPK